MLVWSDILLVAAGNTNSSPFVNVHMVEFMVSEIYGSMAWL